MFQDKKAVFSFNIIFLVKGTVILYFDQTNGIVKASDLYEFILYKVLGATYLGAENTELMIIDVVLRFYG